MVATRGGTRGKKKNIQNYESLQRIETLGDASAEWRAVCNDNDNNYGDIHIDINIDANGTTAGRAVSNNNIIVSNNNGVTVTTMTTSTTSAVGTATRRSSRRSGTAAAAAIRTTAARSNAARRSGGGGKKQSAYHHQQHHHQQRQQTTTLASDPRLIRAMKESHYEAFIDPFRGVVPCFSLCHNGTDNAVIISDADANDDMDAESPWRKCCGALNERCSGWTFGNDAGGEAPEVVDVDDDDDGENDDEDDDGNDRDDDRMENSALLVQCGCPAVDKWAADEYEAHEKRQLKEAAKRKKKKKAAKKTRKRRKNNDDIAEENALMVDENGNEVVSKNNNNAGEMNGIKEKKDAHRRHLICGERKADSTMVYPCDSNPYCLASLGGIVDTYRHSAAKARRLTDRNKVKLSQAELSDQIRNNMMTALDSSSKKTNGKRDKNNKGGDTRRSILINHDAVEAHVSRFICGNSAQTKKFLQNVQSVHKPLVFQPQNQTSDLNPNSLFDDDPHDIPHDGRLELSQPSGLRNLGATCYLNSQLQCLAQNLGFIEGLFTWRKPAIDSGSELDRRMSKVLSNMQSILAMMRYGPDRVLCTNEFASALSLENDEMQDPNEFARLLFDRMSESFRRSAEITFGAEQNGLGELLPSVFGGTTSYVTRCCECNMKSVQKEDFMEISVPIVDNEGASSKSKTKDIDVQQCVNAYFHPESLEGDDQYECSGCNKKCDASRRMVLAKLPPVLNIQLARYVFDRETLSKRKLSTKVLLPKTLEIPEDATWMQNVNTNYILCAVQNHLGSSAHGGHYVAEVMDWTTGVWYEFNDEDVTILEDGPSSSFEPSEIEDEMESEQRAVSGSGDAYNLFYVEQSYLSKKCEGELQTFMKSERITSPGPQYYENDNILTSVKFQRRERFCLELEIQTKNDLRKNRIVARQKKIIEKLLLPRSKLAIGNESECSIVWVDSAFLQRFFSFEDGLEDIFQGALGSSIFVCGKAFLCQHSKGLHPKVLRQGKLLRSDVYNAIESIMVEEFSMHLGDQGLDPQRSQSASFTDHKFLEGSNLACSDCGLWYQQQARRKHDVFKTLVSIHDDLLPGNNDFDQNDIVDPSTTYAISRTFATSFKKYAEKKVNELHNLTQKKSSDKGRNPSCTGGLDMIELSEVIAIEKTNDQNIDQGTDNRAEAPDPFKGEDPTSKISCQHNCCPLMHNGKSVRLIPGEVWHKIAKVFPNAAAHQFELLRDDAIGNCVRCHAEKEEENLFPQKLDEWRREISQPGALKDILTRGGQENELPAEIEIFLQHLGQQLTLHALHHTDVQRWRDSIGVVDKFLKSRKKCNTIKKQLEELLFVFTESSSLSREWKFRSLTCKEHHLAVGLPIISDRQDVRNWLEKLHGLNVVLLLGQEYRDLMSSLSALESILYGTGSNPLPEESQPPSVVICCQKGKPTINIDPQSCTSGCCVTCFSDECAENGTVVPKPRQRQQSKPSNDVVLIEESSKGPMCKVLVHEIENDVDVDVATTQIMLDLSNEDAPVLTSNGRPRRSRKARGGGFPVYEVEMALDGNLAHFKLLLHQSKSKELFCQHLYLLNTLSNKPAEELHPGSCNLKTLHEINQSLYSNKEATNPEMQKNCTIHLILSYHSHDYSKSDGTRRSSRKRMGQEEKQQEEELLLSLSNISCGGWKTSETNETSVEANKSKRRRQERGFQGTFLQSSSEVDVPVTPPAALNKSDLMDMDAVFPMSWQEKGFPATFEQPSYEVDLPVTAPLPENEDKTESFAIQTEMDERILNPNNPMNIVVLPHTPEVVVSAKKENDLEALDLSVKNESPEVMGKTSDCTQNSLLVPENPVKDNDDVALAMRDNHGVDLDIWVGEQLSSASRAIIRGCTEESDLLCLKKQIVAAISANPDHGAVTRNSLFVKDKLIEHLQNNLKK